LLLSSAAGAWGFPASMGKKWHEKGKVLHSPIVLFSYRDTMPLSSFVSEILQFEFISNLHIYGYIVFH
jgi:hypothetical protein